MNVDEQPTTARARALAGADILDPDCPVSPAELLLVLPLTFRVVDGRVLFDLQSRDSLVRYLKWFESIIVAGPRLEERRVPGGDLEGDGLGPGSTSCTTGSSSYRCPGTAG